MLRLVRNFAVVCYGNIGSFECERLCVKILAPSNANLAADNHSSAQQWQAGRPLTAVVAASGVSEAKAHRLAGERHMHNLVRKHSPVHIIHIMCEWSERIVRAHTLSQAAFR